VLLTESCAHEVPPGRGGGPLSLSFSAVAAAHSPSLSRPWRRPPLPLFVGPLVCQRALSHPAALMTLTPSESLSHCIILPVESERIPGRPSAGRPSPTSDGCGCARAHTHAMERATAPTAPVLVPPTPSPPTSAFDASPYVTAAAPCVILILLGHDAILSAPCPS
jgi:hypothetical protein